MNIATSKTVLIVDENPDIRHLIEIVVQNAGRAAKLARTIDEALRLIDVQPFELLICDVGISDGNCEPLVQNLISRTPAIPMILFNDRFQSSLASPLRSDHCFTVERFNFRQLAKVVNVLFGLPEPPDPPDL